MAAASTSGGAFGHTATQQQQQQQHCTLLRTFAKRRLPRQQAQVTKALSGQQQQQQVPSLTALIDSVGGAITKAQRYVQPRPAGFPPGPLGDASTLLLTSPLDFLTRMRRTYGPVVGLLLGGEWVILVSSPAAAKQVLVEQPDVFVKAGTAFFPGSSLTGNGLLVSDGDVWRRQRRMANPAFRKAAVERYTKDMVAATKQLLAGPFASAATAAAVRDVYADFNQLTLSITLAALFGIRPDSNEDSSSGSSSASSSQNPADSTTAAQVVAAVEKAFTYFAARGAAAMILPEWVPTPDNVAFKEAVQQLDELVYGIINSRQATNWQQLQSKQQQQQQGGGIDSSSGAGNSGASCTAPGVYTDLLQALLDSVDDFGQPMSKQALRDELMTLLVAGQETSAILLGWAAALLAHNPKAQQAAAAEVQAAFCPVAQPSSSSTDVAGSNNRYAEPNAADIGKLPFVTAIVLEALRLYSPAYMVGRCANRDVQLTGGYQLPAGTTILVSPYLLHREPSNWRDPAGFRPDRWLPLLTKKQQQQQGVQQQQQGQQCPITEQPGQQRHQEHVRQQPSQQSAQQQHWQQGQQQQQQQELQQYLELQHSRDNNGKYNGSGGTSNTNTCPEHRVASSASSSSPYNFMSILQGMGPNGAFMPFGAGPRTCIGTGFAMIEVVLVLAMLLQRYELQPVNPAAGFPQPKPMLTLRPAAVPLRVMPRQ